MTNSNTVLLLEHKPTTTLSKKARSEVLFTSLTLEGKSRKEIIQQFVEQIGLTENGAKTYYANFKRISTHGGNFHSSTKKKIVEIEVDLDSRPMYTVCTPINDKKYGKLVDSTVSHYSFKDAKNSRQKGELVVQGLPNMNTPFKYLRAAS